MFSWEKTCDITIPSQVWCRNSGSTSTRKRQNFEIDALVRLHQEGSGEESYGLGEYEWCQITSVGFRVLEPNSQKPNSFFFSSQKPHSFFENPIVFFEIQYILLMPDYWLKIMVSTAPNRFFGASRHLILYVIVILYFQSSNAFSHIVSYK